MTGTQATQTRQERGIDIYRAGQVNPNGAPGQWYVASQSQPGYKHLTATPWAACGPRCDCQDYQKRGGPCKHIWAASIAEAARRVLRRWENGEKLSVIEEDLAVMGISGVPAEVSLGWESYLRATQILMGSL